MLLDALQRNARERPQAIAVVDDRGQTTWGELDQKARRLAKVIRGRTKRDCVGILLPSGAAFVTAFYATLYAGKVAVPLNFLLGERETLHVLKDSGVDLVVTVQLILDKVDAGAAVKSSSVQILDLLALKPTLGLMLRQLVGLPSPPKNEDALAAILYTSGTSGLPKGVELTHGNLQRDADACIKHVGLDRVQEATGRAGSDHRFLGVVPLFHSTGMLATLIAPVTLGAKTIFTARFSPAGTMNAIREHDVSVMAAVPSMYNALARVKDATPEDFKGLFMPLSGGEPLPGRIRQTFRERFNCELMEGYGLTETCGPVCVNHPEAHREGSVGRPIPGCEIRIANDEGKAMPAGEIGEIQLRGPMVFRGYHNLAAETAAAMTSDGFFRSGDLGKVDEDGFLFITGRKKDMLIVSGENVYPREIEELIARMPGVSEAAVIGRPDEMRGEVPVAFVIAAEGQQVTAEAVRAYCREAGLPQFKIPRDIHVVEDLPRSPTGKVLKRELAARMLAA
jgi:long-chain acyl-CoA synthetase